MSKWGIIGVILSAVIIVGSLSAYIYIDNKSVVADPLPDIYKAPLEPYQRATSSNSLREEADGNVEETISLGAPAANESYSNTKAWETFQVWFTAIKQNDLAKVNQYSYQKQFCTSSETCEKYFAFMKEYFSPLKQSSFVNVWEDKRQIIISSDPIYKNSVEGRGYTRSYMYFAYVNGSLKVVAVEPDKEWIHKKDYTDSSPEVVEANLAERMKDTDKDALTDKEERCEEIWQEAATCKKTDPNKRDSDGDGLWDGIESKLQ